MAEDILWNDDEKVEQLKKWWKKYGNLLSTAIVIVLAGLVGWQYWQRHETKISAQASIEYENLLASEQTQPTATANLAEELKKNFSSTPYADLAAFMLAKKAIDVQDYATAIRQLQWVVAHARSKNLAELARIRLARIFLAQDHAQAALDILNTNLQVYPGLGALLKGSAYQALGKLNQARIAYQFAVTHLPSQTTLSSLASMKLNDLAVSKT